MSLFKLHRINSPEIRMILRDREMRLEHTINLFRFFLFALLAIGGFFITYIIGDFREEFILFRISLILGNIALVFTIHQVIKRNKYKPFLKYVTVTLDISLVFIINVFFRDYIIDVNINTKEFMYAASILLILFNLLSALRIRKYVIYYSTILAIFWNLILHINGESELKVILFTSFAILISGFYNLWISNFILQSFVANNRLSNAMNEIKQANEEITAQRDQIERQNNRITDSIAYARRIQHAVLPQEDEIKEVFEESFVLYMPKDIVSGDFYWIKETEVFTKKYKVVSVVDCTGHGVPGAFMSMLGTSLLNEIILEFYSELTANEILDRLKEEVIKYLHQTKEKSSIRDGMDLSLCIIDYEDMKLQYAGAYNSVYIVRNPKKTNTREIEELKADRMPIGIYLKGDKSFTNQVVDINKGDVIYLFSDGYADQFGGEQRKKYNLGRFREKILEVSHLHLNEQKYELENEIKSWMGDNNQLDDITMVGVKI